MSKEPEHVKQLPLEWHLPEDLPSHYVNNIVVQQTPHEFIISFFETLPPLILGSPEEQQQQLEALTSVRAKCVARIIVNPNRMKDFIQALQRTYNGYLKKLEMEEE